MSTEELVAMLEKNGVDHVVVRNSNVMGCCPFHGETRPSWGISIHPPHLHACFSCGEKGTLFSLLVHFGMSKEKAAEISKRNALDLTVEFDKPKEEPSRIEEENIWTRKLNRRARLYAIHRGLKNETIKKLELVWDHETNRLVFPWYVPVDDEETLVGATGRALDNNPAKTLPLWGTKKGDYLYLPARKLSNREPLILVEGEFDAARVYDAGFKNVGALSFGRLSRKQKSFVLNFRFPEIVLFFDDDLTGAMLSTLVENMLSPHFQIAKVSYDKVASRYKNSKLDPASLSRSDIRVLLTKYKDSNNSLVTL